MIPPIRAGSVAFVDAENRFLASIISVEVARTFFAVSALALFGDRRENFWCVDFVELTDNNLVCDCLFERYQDRSIDCSDRLPTSTTFHCDQFAVLLRNDETAAVYASLSMGDARKIWRVGGHSFIVAPVCGFGRAFVPAMFRFWLFSECMAGSIKRNAACFFESPGSILLPSGNNPTSAAKADFR